MKCIVKNCTNKDHQGVFFGSLCAPCHEFITTGNSKYSQAYRNLKCQWVGLTDVEIINAANSAPFEDMQTADDYIYVIARAIEAKLKEKNT